MLISSGIAVNSSKNPIYSLCYLILTFLISIFYLIYKGIDFLAFIFLIIYIGAIIILFLFVIMLLNLKMIELKNNIVSYIPLGILIIILLLVEFVLIFNNNYISIDISFRNYINWSLFIDVNYRTIHFIGLYIYSYYIILFLLSGLILFIATLGAVMIIYKKNEIYEINRKKQNQGNQYFVKYEMNIRID